MIGIAALMLMVLTQQAPGQSCGYDRAAMLALDQAHFDQDMTGGWRQLNNIGCDAEAADLIKLWRETHAERDGILYWHEGQLRANANQTTAAIALFEQARKTRKEDHGFGWNLYVDGTIAFLHHDRKALALARDRLARLPKPAGFAPIGPDGKPLTIAWPLNLQVLDGFLACWGRPYKKAYACAKPMFTVSRP